ncbi:MAG: 16S rRNA (cytosine(967)-C(5))-methyltransferase RsmB [Vicinamibacterales bacterium]
MTAPARVAAYHALRAITSGRADLPSALADSRERLTDDRDKSLAAEIVAGTLRWQRTLDHLIVHFTHKPLARLDAEVVVILRLSLYQLLHLDRVPASAVVDDAVDLTRTARKPSASGFVNAVLRATLRQRQTLPVPARPEDLSDRPAVLAYLGITYSHPEWLVSRWLDRYGFNATEQWVRFNNETPLLTLRANRLRTTRESLGAALADHGIGTEPTRYAPDGLVVSSGNPLRQTERGDFLVQDEASQLVSLTVGARPGERVLDLCASPGGKTTAMASDMANTGFIVACDVRTKRVQLLRETVRDAGAVCVDVVHIASDGALPFEGAFDRVLVDAPCSGLGTLRRDPDIRWRRLDTELPALSAEQVQLLLRAAGVVAPGGRLVYATCSSEPEENDDVVAAFLTAREDFRLLDLRHERTTIPTPILDARGILRTLPFEHRLDAFFAAALVRQ